MTKWKHHKPRRISMPPEFAALKGKNFMTPDVIAYYRTDVGAVELSEGSGFNPGTRIYGVTVRTTVDPDVHDSLGHRLSKMCTSLREAQEYIDNLGHDEDE